MKPRQAYFLVGAILVILAVWYLLKKDNPSEHFKVLGALAHQKDVYYRCLSECERSDPAKQMTPSKGSQLCQQYCDSVLTDVTRRGGPSYPRDLPVATAVAPTRVISSYDECGDGTHGDWCRQQFATAGEIDEKCRQDCEYSTLPPKECMKDCSNVREVAKVSGWSWK